VSAKSWNAGIIRPVPVAPTGPYQNSSAPGVWTLDQVAYWEKQDLWPTAGNLDPSLFIENLFSTYLYAGNASTLAIPNGIDLASKGGLIWMKKLDSNIANTSHTLVDTVRGKDYYLNTNNTGPSSLLANIVSSFDANGFTLSNQGGLSTNNTGSNYVSWTFRKQAKFFDVVTYTGNGVDGRIIATNVQMGVPGAVIIKRTDTTSDWKFGDRLGTWLMLNQTYGDVAAAWAGGNVSPQTNGFQLSSYGGDISAVNANGGTYVAYVFAHNAGGFGASGTENVITCGRYTGNGTSSTSTQDITLGYEPQFVLIKNTTTSSGTPWLIIDNMRGWSNNGTSGADPALQAQSSDAENTSGYLMGHPTATGFQIVGDQLYSNLSTRTYIYIAIRRGPMRTPTSGTSVFSPVARSGSSSTANVGTTTSFVSDLAIIKDRTFTAYGPRVGDRLRGNDLALNTATTNTEDNNADGIEFNKIQNGITVGAWAQINGTGTNYINWLFSRAPGFFDVVCYTGTGSATTITHNLASVPELMIVKTRSTVDFWYVYHKDVGNTKYLQLQSTAAPATSSVVWNNTTPTSSVFSVGVATNGSGVTHVAYLFSTVTGVSKVGSYTGTGTTSVKQVDCGFTGGARFVLIKRTDSTGDWYIWDSARGIVAGNDPYLLLNSTAAEVTTTDWVDTYSLGFELSTASGNNVNINNATYIFLAIA
jgi:hypothetical protein